MIPIWISLIIPGQHPCLKLLPSTACWSKALREQIGNLELAYGPIAGVIKDYHQESLKNKVDPLVMTVEPLWWSNFLIQVDAQNIVAETPISIGLRQKGAVEITQGLNLGDNIVLQGVLKVRPGAKVKPQQEQWRNEASSANVIKPRGNVIKPSGNAIKPSDNAIKPSGNV